MTGSFPHPDLSGYVLAGGASSRMGQDKALMSLGGRTLVEAAVLKLREVCCDVAVLSGGDPAPDRLRALQRIGRTVPERGRHQGPVAGIAAALADARTRWTMVLAVDQPYLPADLLRRWFLSADVSGQPVSCMVLGTLFQPIPVLIQTRLCQAVAQSLGRGEAKVRTVLESAASGEQGRAIHTFVVEDTPEAKGWFHNLNCPADLPVSTAQIPPSDVAR